MLIASKFFIEKTNDTVIIDLKVKTNITISSLSAVYNLCLLQHNNISERRRAAAAAAIEAKAFKATAKKRMGKKTKKVGKGKEKTEKKTAKAEEKKARRETKKLSPEDDIDAILVIHYPLINLF